MPLGLALARMENDLVKAEQAKYDSLAARLVGLTKNSVCPTRTVKIRLRLVDDDKDPYEQGRVQVPLQAGDHIVAGNRDHGPVRHAVVWTSPHFEASQSGLREVSTCHVIYCDNGALSITSIDAWMKSVGVAEVFRVWYLCERLPVVISHGLARTLFDAATIISDDLDDFGFVFFTRTRKVLHIQQRDEAKQRIERAVRSGAATIEESGDIVVAE